MGGRMIQLSRPRIFVNDLLHFARSVPSIPVQRRMNLGRLGAARSSCATPRPPWSALFVKGYALTAAALPELRRAYCRLPWPHLYEYPHSVAAVAVEREWAGERAVLMVRIKRPESLSLAAIAERIRRAQTASIESLKDFRRQLWLSGLPRPLRRLLWWLALNGGPWRGNACGTFGLSVYSALGVESLHPISPLTVLLNYGVIAPDGTVDVRLIYDHRVFDGATAARALLLLEQTLNTAIAEELRHWPADPTPAPNENLPGSEAAPARH